jgi:hypothetical protein
MNWLVAFIAAVVALAFTFLSEAALQVFLGREADITQVGYVLFAAWLVLVLSAIEATKARY